MLIHGIAITSLVAACRLAAPTQHRHYVSTNHLPNMANQITCEVHTAVWNLQPRCVPIHDSDLTKHQHQLLGVTPFTPELMWARLCRQPGLRTLNAVDHQPN